VSWYRRAVAGDAIFERQAGFFIVCRSTKKKEAFDLFGVCKRRIRFLLKRPRKIGADRRRFLRVKCHNLVRFEYVNGAQCSWISNLSNISKGGVRTSVPECLKLNEIVKMVIHYAQIDIIAPVAARVVWIHPLSRGVGYAAGFAFLETDLYPHKGAVGRYLEWLLRSSAANF
jgi:hypothetical protein